MQLNMSALTKQRRAKLLLWLARYANHWDFHELAMLTLHFDAGGFFVRDTLCLTVRFPLVLAGWQREPNKVADFAMHFASCLQQSVQPNIRSQFSDLGPEAIGLAPKPQNASVLQHDDLHGDFAARATTLDQESSADRSIGTVVCNGAINDVDLIRDTKWIAKDVLQAHPLFRAPTNVMTETKQGSENQSANLQGDAHVINEFSPRQPFLPDGCPEFVTNQIPLLSPNIYDTAAGIVEHAAIVTPTLATMDGDAAVIGLTETKQSKIAPGMNGGWTVRVYEARGVSFALPTLQMDKTVSGVDDAQTFYFNVSLERLLAYVSQVLSASLGCEFRVLHRIIVRYWIGCIPAHLWPLVAAIVNNDETPHQNHWNSDNQKSAALSRVDTDHIEESCFGRLTADLSRL